MKTIYKRKPKDFNAIFNVVGILISCGDKILCLLRRDDVCEENKWGFVAGKVHSNESLKDALEREIREETGLVIPNPLYKITFYVRYPEFDYEMHMYSFSYDSIPEVRINKKENKEYRWIDIKKFNDLPVVNGNKEIIKELFLHKDK